MVASSPPPTSSLSSSDDFVIVSSSGTTRDNNGRRRASYEVVAAADEEIATGSNAAVDVDSSRCCSSPSAAHQQRRSLIQSLWSEAATSTADLHQRRRNRNNWNEVVAASSSDSAKRSRGNKKRAHHSNCGYVSTQYSRRAKRVAAKVWLAAFAAVAVALIIKIHVFIYYRVFSDHYYSNQRDHGLLGEGMPLINDAAMIQTLLDNHNIGPEDLHCQMTLEDAHSYKLTPLESSNMHGSTNSIDTSQYTIRINTWHRDEQLLLSINHHAKCDGVAQIHIVWCDKEHDPPDNIAYHTSGKVRIERHDINSLNERFKILTSDYNLETTTTLGVLSLDDDVLRPCEALDAAFIRWLQHPERMVGFDVRTHVIETTAIEEDKNNKGDGETKKKKKTTTNWKYGYMSTTETSNSYSLTLPRASFIHRDYLNLYIKAIPRPIYFYVAQHFECEDIAMSFFVSSLTNGQPPLITDYWAVKSLVKLYSEKKISGGKDHKSSRDTCVNVFAELLGLKEDGKWGPLQHAELIHNSNDDVEENAEEEHGVFFGYGAEPQDWDTIEDESSTTLLSSASTRLKELIATMKELKSKSYSDQKKWLNRKKYDTMKEAKKVGMIEKTVEWERRWKESGEEKT